MTEWKTYRLGDICKRVCSGGTPKSTEPTYYDGDIPWLNTKEINFNRIYSTERCITQKGLDNSSAKWIDANCVIVAMYGATAAKVAINKIPLTTNQACCNLSIDEKIADYHYVYYWLCANYTELASLANGGAQQNLNAQQIKDFEISLPPLEEQRRIAGILGAIDDKIENNRRINTNLELQAQALFDEIFFSDNDWEYTTLGMLTEEVKTKVKGMSAKVLSPISSGELVLSEDYFTKQVYSQDISKYIVVEPMSFAYNPARINIGSIGINSFDFVGCVSPVYVVFKTKSEYENFFRLFVKSDIFKDEVKSRAIGGVRQTLSYHDFAMITTKHPPIDSIRTFNTQYNTLLDIINHNNTENRTLATLRDTLLPKLMNGEIKTE